jgi:hypothetical protein
VDRRDAIARAAVPLAGTLAGAVALVWFQETPLGTMLWSVATIASAYGYGLAIARLTGHVVSHALTAITGLAALLAISTAAARVGILDRNVQFAALAVGLAVSASLRPRESSSPGVSPSVGLCALGAVAAIWLVLTASMATSTVIADGSNHGFVVKRLWDTGSLDVVHHQVGIQLMGASYFALAGGASAAGVFEVGVCAALLVWVLASELAGRDGSIRQVLFSLAVVAVP